MVTTRFLSTFVAFALLLTLALSFSHAADTPSADVAEPTANVAAADAARQGPSAGQDDAWRQYVPPEYQRFIPEQINQSPRHNQEDDRVSVRDSDSDSVGDDGKVSSRERLDYEARKRVRGHHGEQRKQVHIREERTESSKTENRHRERERDHRHRGHKLVETDPSIYPVVAVAAEHVDPATNTDAVSDTEASSYASRWIALSGVAFCAFAVGLYLVYFVLAKALSCIQRVRYSEIADKSSEQASTVDDYADAEQQQLLLHYHK